MSVFLPLLAGETDPALLQALARIGPLVLPPSHANTLPLPQQTPRYVLFENGSLDEATAALDQGADKVVLPLAQAKQAIGVLPADRLILLLDVANVSAVSDTVRNGISGVLIKTPAVDVDFVSSVSRFFTGSTIHVLPADTTSPPSQSTIRGLLAAGAILVLPTALLTLTASTERQINVADAFLSPLTSDRPDGLFPTVVSAHNEGGRSLGLVYSSAESIKESIVTGKGVYQSRKHGLWRKGETSGATQDIVSIRLDCDSDAIEFSVIQHGAGFCHLNRASCFGGDEAKGLRALEKTLQSRLESAPEGSYTRRLFNDPALLQAKIMEEADELCRAVTKDEVAFEAADLIYFALTRCVAAGWNKASETTAATNGKPTVPAPAPAKQKAVLDPNAPIRMHTYDLAATSSQERAQLLHRPVLKYDEMLQKVKPIVDDVRVRGDAALLELTAKFD
ncbi:hypothetical protein EVJ58_g7697, partial [Rhodofomes roseus]